MRGVARQGHRLSSAFTAETLVQNPTGRAMWLKTEDNRDRGKENEGEDAEFEGVEHFAYKDQ
jgi:hypothetical protein